MNSEQIIKKLRTVFWTMLVVAAIFAFLVEFILIDHNGGAAVGNKVFEFFFQTVAILLTMGAIFFSLRMFRLKPIERRLQDNPLSEYHSLSIIRMSLLWFPMLMDIIGYWLFVNGSFGWLGTILFLSFAFVYPSKQRLCDELKMENDKKNVEEK